MPTPPVSPTVSAERKAAIEAALTEGYSRMGERGPRGSAVQRASTVLGCDDGTLGTWVRRQERLKQSGAANWSPDWGLARPTPAARPALSTKPKIRVPAGRAYAAPSGVKRYILTAAQDDTRVHEPFWRNLQAYAAHMGAELIVGPFTYQKGLFEDHATRSGLFAEAVRPFIRYDRMDLGPLLFCAEMNTLPTATRPLSGLESYSGQKWAVFPHAKIQLVSVPTFVDAPAKQIMTTGCVTLPNYVARKSGLKAEFHHVQGATLVEIDGAGRLFCRQLNATDDGAFQDLDAIVRDGMVTRGHRVEGVTWGDLHRKKLDPEVALGAWGYDVVNERSVSSDNMLDALRPRHSFWHDALDFDVRNHHRIDDAFHRYAMVAEKTDLVRDEVRQVARFLRATERDWGRQVVVYSNHDDAITKWVRTADFRADAPNAPYFLRLALAMYEAIDRADHRFNLFRHALAAEDERGLEGIEFVDDDQSYVICQSASGGGVECGMHGHLGLNGARGSALAYTKTAVKINRGHEHAPSILDGVYTSGLCGMLRQGYNRGLSGWAHTQTVTYPNAKRSLVTFQGSAWRA